MRLDGFLKNTRIRDEQGDSDWQREGAELAQTLTMGKKKGESDAQEEASLRLQG